MKSFTVERDTYSGQTKGCAVSVHIGYARLLWHPEWARSRSEAFLRICLAAPRHNPETGYLLRMWSVRWGDSLKRANRKPFPWQYRPHPFKRMK